jgi:rhodanese-related sulfurtransferase
VTATFSPEEVRTAFVTRREIALIDLREEAAFALGHPLFAVQLPPERIDIEAGQRIPRKATPIVLYDDGTGIAESAGALQGAWLFGCAVAGRQSRGLA